MTAIEHRSVLETIADDTRQRVETQQAAVPLEEIRRRASATPTPDRFPFERALRADGMSFVAEVKKASPSKGVIATDFPYLSIAADYERAGAAAISVLTEPHFFMGSNKYLTDIAAARSIPVLRKDFVVSEYQIFEARALGAAAVLLIVALLDDTNLRRYLALSDELGLSALVEVHDESEARRALATGARIIGVNNRDLRTFAVDPATTERIAPLLPPSVILVAESGVSDAATVARLHAAGADAILVGEALMRAGDKTAALAGLRKDLPKIKICGLKTMADIDAVNVAPPDFIGFVFAPSRRQVTPDQAATLRAALRPSILPVGVFVDANPDLIADLAQASVIDLVQLHGHETDEDIELIKHRTGGLSVIKSVRMGENLRVAGGTPVRAGGTAVARPEPGGHPEGATRMTSGRPGPAGARHPKHQPMPQNTPTLPCADFLLFDSTAGSGLTFDWSTIPPVEHPFFLAGGITTTTIDDALAVPNVFAVDVSSGAETDDHKDPSLVAELVRHTRVFGRKDR